jgi:hypothetical protein
MVMEHQQFTLLPANGFVWNKNELIQFLIDNQDKKIQINTRDEGVCLKSAGIYQLLENFKFADVVIKTNNQLEQHEKFIIQIKHPHMYFKVTDQNYQQYHTWNKRKVFGCLYNRPLWHRVALAAEMQITYNDISLINFRSDPNDPDQQQLFEIQQLFEQAPQSLVKFCQAKHSWPVQVETTDSYTVNNTTNAHTNQLARFYPEFLIDLVAETWTQGRCFFPTEKTVRPMLLKKPMIVMGSRDYLDYLHQMGFRTFNEFWNENYDGYEGKERYLIILQLIDTIARKSKTELNDMYQAMEPILDHNYNLLLNQSYSTDITYIC